MTNNFCFQNQHDTTDSDSRVTIHGTLRIGFQIAGSIRAIEEEEMEGMLEGGPTPPADLSVEKTVEKIQLVVTFGTLDFIKFFLPD